MTKLRARLGVIQNVGWLDRVIRVLIGSVMLLYPLYLIMTNEGLQTPWPVYSMLLSVYPWLTGILGFDPIYALFFVRTCDTSERNRCGTFPYEIDAALGNHPIPNNDIERSLENSHHKN